MALFQGFVHAFLIPPFGNVGSQATACSEPHFSYLLFAGAPQLPVMRAYLRPLYLGCQGLFSGSGVPDDLPGTRDDSLWHVERGKGPGSPRERRAGKARATCGSVIEADW